MDITRIEGPTSRQTASKPGGHRGRPKDPLDSHQEKAQHDWGPQGVGRPHRSAELSLWPPVSSCHMVLPGEFLIQSYGAHAILPKLF
jgi:hypothetical protein